MEMGSISGQENESQVPAFCSPFPDRWLGKNRRESLLHKYLCMLNVSKKHHVPSESAKKQMQNRCKSPWGSWEVKEFLFNERQEKFLENIMESREVSYSWRRRASLAPSCYPHRCSPCCFCHVWGVCVCPRVCACTCAHVHVQVRAYFICMATDYILI